MRIQRIKKIFDYIEKHGTCTYNDICEAFNISLSTARRDIDVLIKDSGVRKVYGGITYINGTSVSQDSTFNLNNSDLSILQSEDALQRLKHIGKIAASYVEPGDVIYIGSGATAFHIFEFLKDIPKLTIVTNNLLIVSNNPKSNNEDIILVGGKIDYYTKSTVGLQTISFLQSLNIDKAFISCNGISLNKGFSNSGDSEVAIKNCIIKNCNTIFMLADHTKFEKVSLYTFASFENIDYLITDIKPGNEYIEVLNENQVKLEY